MIFRKGRQSTPFGSPCSITRLTSIIERLRGCKAWHVGL